MNKVMLQTKNEFYKLAARKKYIVMLILSIAACMLRYGGTMLVERLSEGRVTIKSNIMLEMLPFMAEIIVPLVLFMAVTDLFASEIQEDSLKAVLMRPLSRFKILTSKLIASFAMGAVYMAAIFVVCVVIQTLSGGKVASILLPSVMAYVIDLVPLFTVAVMAALINMIASGPTLSMLLSIGVYAVMKYANYFSASFGRMFFTAYLGWHKLWLGNTLPVYALAADILIIFSTMLIFYALSYILFERKEF